MDYAKSAASRPCSSRLSKNKQEPRREVISRAWIRCAGGQMNQVWERLWKDESGQDIAEYAVMVALILVIVVGTIRLIGSNANTVFSNVASAIQ